LELAKTYLTPATLLIVLVPKSYCAPDNLQAKDAANVFVEWIKKHPEYETQSAANAFVLAMREKYSCR